MWRKWRNGVAAVGVSMKLWRKQKRHENDVSKRKKIMKINGEIIHQRGVAAWRKRQCGG
jgi:hypothetical protein